MSIESDFSFINCGEVLDFFTQLQKYDSAVPQPPLPLLALIGPSGSGKSTLIDYLRITHCHSREGKVAKPHAFLDFTFPNAPRTFLGILINLRDQLQRQADSLGQHLTFPRFDLGASIAAAFAIQNALPSWREEQLQERLNEAQSVFATVNELGTPLEILLPQIRLLISSLKSIEHLTLVQAIVKQIVSNPVCAWYRLRSELEINAEAPREAVLLRLYTMSIPHTPDWKRLVEELLPAAFLADIHAAFDSSVWGKSTFVTLFLDGYETLLTPSTNLGMQLLESLISNERDQQGATDPLLVVLGSRNHPMPDLVAGQEGVSSVSAQYNRWVEHLSASIGDSSNLWNRYFPIVLNTFNYEDSRQLLSNLAGEHSLDAAFTDLVDEQFLQTIQNATGGLPIYIALAAESIFEARQRGYQVDPDEFDQMNIAINSVISDNSSELGDALLTLLLHQLPESEQRDLLFCAAPRFLNVEMLSAEIIFQRQDLVQQRWMDSLHFPFFRVFEGGYIFLHPLIRRFLLYHLQLLPDDFILIHTRLQTYFALSARDDENASIEEAYHALALGNSEPAISLAHRIQREKLPLWESLLEAVEQAPTFLMPPDIGQRASVALSDVRRNHYIWDGITAVILYTWLLSTTRHGSIEAARLRHKKGLAYYGLLGGNRQANLQAAIACYQAALEIYVRDQFPVEWAFLQHDLGTAFRSLPGVDRQSTLNTSTIHFQAALEVFTREQFPVEWAMTHHDLGFSYCLWPSDDRQDVLLKAVAHYSAALEVLTREDTPNEWAETQTSLGIAYRDLPRGDRQDNQQRAIACFQAAMTVYTYDDYPFGWADAMHHLGVTYTDLPGENRQEHLKNAITCFQEALRVRDRYEHPYEWGFTQQQLAVAYHHLPGDDYQINQQKAIIHLNDALQAYTREDYPIEWAIMHASLSELYQSLQYGDRRANLQLALDHTQNELQIFTRQNFPTYWAGCQLVMAIIQREMSDENDQLSIQAAIMHFEAAQQVFTPQEYPLEWADIQKELGIIYRDLLGKQDQIAVKKALICFRAALRVYKRRMYPVEWATIQRELGTTYRITEGGDLQTKITKALVSYRKALRVWKLDAFPHDYRAVQLDCAETEAERSNWIAAHDSYTAALQAEDLLVALGAGVPSYDMVLMRGRDAAIRDGFALIQMEKLAEATAVIEKGRTRWLSDAMSVNAADPTRISDPHRRERYLAAHEALLAAQEALHDPETSNLDDTAQRRVRVERATTYRNAKDAFDAIIAEIRSERDPEGFLYESFDGAAVLNTAERIGDVHAIVYLASTPWGGFALAAVGTSSLRGTPSHFVAQEFPLLTDAFVENFIETHQGTRKGPIIGGFDCAQQNSAYELLKRWPGNTFREQATALHQVCEAAGSTGSLDAAATQILSTTDSELVQLIDCPIIVLSEGERELLAETFNHWVLHYELLHCQERLAEAVMQPLLAWLLDEGATSFTIIPCGALAAFPLMATPLADGRTVGETLPGSVSPCARVLMRERSSRTTQQREGISVMGNPLPTHELLEYGEAEALTLAAFGRQLHLPTVVKVRETATRNAFVDALKTRYVVGASCHGIFDTKEVLHSHLQFAYDEQVTLGEMLGGQYDLSGLRLLMLSSCQTAILDIRGARNEVRSLTAGMLQAGARAVLSALWAVDDLATYLLMVRFAQEWFPYMVLEPPSEALSRAQQWLRTVTHHQLQQWTADLPIEVPISTDGHRHVRVRGRGYRLLIPEAEAAIRRRSRLHPSPDTKPYADPYYWAGFQINGW